MLPLLLVFLVGTVYFGTVFMLQSAATHAAQQGAIAAAAVPAVGATADDFADSVAAAASQAVTASLAWLPVSIGDGISKSAVLAAGLLTVTVTIDIAGGSSPLLPQINLPAFGPIPPPGLTELTGVARVTL